MSRFVSYLLVAWCRLVWSTSADCAEWSVPLAGNAFRSAPAPEGKGLQRDGTLAWGDADDRFSVYFHIDRPASLELLLNGRVPDGHSTLLAKVGNVEMNVQIDGTELGLHRLGHVEVAQAGYVRVDLQGKERSGRIFAEIRDLNVTSETTDLVVEFVKSNEGNMFYWGRRGPSVHLNYDLPKDAKLQYAYSEITVPAGQDVIGSYFMANGFAEGYFGIQVNGPKERRVLFSIWSPFKTDNPRDIPKEQQIVCLGSGPDVRIGEFGNEGSGGQSYLLYPWKADQTYCFLTEVKRDSPSTTVYTSWFRAKADSNWRLVASFRRPMTNTSLKGFHSFLENFNPAFGHVTRSAHYGNVWVCDRDGHWFECSKARFSVDATGRGRHRLDFAGGAQNGFFMLKNCGFFSETATAGEVFTREATSDQQPRITFEELPRPGAE